MRLLQLYAINPLFQVSHGSKALFCVSLEFFDEFRSTLRQHLTYADRYFTHERRPSIRISSYLMNAGGATYEVIGSKIGIGKTECLVLCMKCQPLP